MRIAELPERLIADERKVSILRNCLCGNCSLMRRTNIKSITTPGGEIGADVWKTNDLFGLSVNIHLCGSHDEDVSTDPRDVQYFVKDDEKFVSNEQLTSIVRPVTANHTDDIVVEILTDSLNNLEGLFPIRKGMPDEVEYHYEVKVLYVPYLLNCCHFEVHVFSDESGSMEPIKRATASKNYYRSLSSKIRTELIDRGKIKALDQVAT